MMDFVELAYTSFKLHKRKILRILSLEALIQQSGLSSKRNNSDAICEKIAKGQTDFLWKS